LNHLQAALSRWMLPASTRCRLQVAALPWRRTRDGVEILLITSRDSGRWILPKGWPEKGEALCDAAAREAEEEAGIKGAVRATETGRYFYAKGARAGRTIACEVRVFPLEVKKVSQRWKEAGQRTRKWVVPVQASAMVDEPDLAELILDFEALPQTAA
jgi:8-oxo-dGTP pyrophosphatase MutT (NUDIX family)